MRQYNTQLKLFLSRAFLVIGAESHILLYVQQKAFFDWLDYSGFLCLGEK